MEKTWPDEESPLASGVERALMEHGRASSLASNAPPRPARPSSRECFAIEEPAPPLSTPEGAAPAEPVAEPPPLRLPQRLGKYVLVELLGMGGMAEVFLAHEEEPLGDRRTLVIKRLHPHLLVDERFVQMFVREARVAAGLRHRNIVRIHELAADQGRSFIVMEHIDGLTLQRLARRAWRAGRSLPMELVLAAAADAASALHYAHSFVDDDGTARRIVHRDVSPDNLIIDRAGDTKLLDFGVAKAVGSISVTRTGEVKGKLPYMAPEQLFGRPLDGRADLYSLGATLYWLLTGRRPFRGATDLEMMRAIAYDTPAPPRQLNPRIPEVVERTILRMLAKRPEDRHANGQLVADELTALLPPSRREVAAFVQQAFALDHVEDAEPSGASSFLASAPRTAHLVSEARRVWLKQLEPQRFEPRPERDEADVEPLDDRDTAAAEPLPPLPLVVGTLDEAPPAVAEAAPEDEVPRRPLALAIAAGAGAAALLALAALLLSSADDELRGVPTVEVGDTGTVHMHPRE